MTNHAMVRVKPIDETGWLYLKEEEAIHYIRDMYSPDISKWHIEFIPPMTDSEIEALGEFDGW